METLKTLMQLTDGDPQLRKALSYLEIVKNVQTNGADEKTLLNVLSQMNPKLQPFLRLMSMQEEKKEEKKEEEPFVQYNRPQ